MKVNLLQYQLRNPWTGYSLEFDDEESDFEQIRIVMTQDSNKYSGAGYSKPAHPIRLSNGKAMTVNSYHPHFGWTPDYKQIRCGIVHRNLALMNRNDNVAEIWYPGFCITGYRDEFNDIKLAFPILGKSDFKTVISKMHQAMQCYERDKPYESDIRVDTEILSLQKSVHYTDSAPMPEWLGFREATASSLFGLRKETFLEWFIKE